MTDTKNNDSNSNVVINNRGTGNKEKDRQGRLIKGSKDKENRGMIIIGKRKDSIGKIYAGRSSSKLNIVDKNSKGQSKG